LNTRTNTHLGKKILYALVIVMSSLLLLVSVAGIIGVWVVEQPVSNAAVTVLSVVESSTGVIRASNARVDQAVAALQVKTTEISDASQQLSQNVTDKGLVLVLLPEQKEQQLIQTSSSVRDTYNGLRDSIRNGLDLYRSINRIPFVSLPGPSDDQMQKIDASMTKTQVQVEAVRSQMADFRSGVTDKIDKVGAAASLLNDELNQARDALSQLDSRLAALQALSVRLQQVIPGVLVAIAVIISLILAFLIFTQVEMIRLYVARWRHLGQPQQTLPTDAIAQPVAD
jgi:hypothetical protein